MNIQEASESNTKCVFLAVRKFIVVELQFNCTIFQIVERLNLKKTGISNLNLSGLLDSIVFPATISL
ncbi:unnamed protein product [Caenorhabditis nigoni]